MFERFTGRARKVLSLARQEAQRMNQEFIGTEAVLIGLIMEGGGIAAKILKGPFKLKVEDVRREVERLVSPASAPVVTLGQLPFSPRMRRALEASAETSLKLGHDVIGTESLLLGLIDDPEGLVAQILPALGVKLEGLKAAINDYLGAKLSPKLRKLPQGSLDPMTFAEYQTRARETAVYPNLGKNWMYPALGLGGEVGELLNKLSKIIRDKNYVVDGEVKKKVSSEVGDVLWYLSTLCSEFGLDLATIAVENIAKLTSRKERGKLLGDGDQR
jgi:NTP pyrophosphatase (non-canonical NTP hydrolase)